MERLRKAQGRGLGNSLWGGTLTDRVLQKADSGMEINIQDVYEGYSIINTCGRERKEAGVGQEGSLAAKQAKWQPQL